MAENTIIHEISLAGYKATSAGGMLDLGTWGSYGIEKLHLTLDAAWQDLTITAFFNVKGEVVAKRVVGKDGYADVPWEATKENTFAGRIVFEGSMNGQRRISTNLNYKVTNHSEITDSDPVPTDDRWNQFVTENKEYRDGAFEAAERANTRAEDAEAASDDAQAAARAAKASENAAKASENAAAASENNASISAGAATVSEGNAAASAEKAKASETAAAESASNAAADAAKAASAAKKAADESVAANIAAIEKMQADVASKQTAAAASEKAAAASAVAAAGSAAQAETQKTAAAKSASDAQGYMQTASGAATAANASAKNAVGSEAAAASSATAAAGSATAAAGDAKTANDAATVATDAKAAAVAAQKDAAASKAAAANSAAAAKTSEEAAAKSAADADSTANSIKDSMTQIAANTEAVSQLKEDLGNKGNNAPFKSGQYINTSGKLNSGDEHDLYTNFIIAKKGNKLVSNGGGAKNTNFISIYSSMQEDSYINGVTNTWNAKEKTYTFQSDCYFRLYNNTNVTPSDKIYAYLFSDNELLIEAEAKKNIESIIEYSSNDVIKKFIKQALLTGEKQHIKITAVGNAVVYRENTEYFVNAEDDNGNSYNYYVNNVDKPENHIKLSSSSTTLDLYVDWSVITVGIKQYYIDAYITDKAYNNTAFDFVLKDEIITIKEDIDTIKVKYLKGLDEYSTMYRYIGLTFQNIDQRLTLIGSNDCFENSAIIARGIYKPSLGRKTIRDPSWMYYKGYFYIVYNVEATEDNPMQEDDSFDEIGVVRTKDFVNFYEYPHVHLSESGLTLYSAIWAPAFCVVDNKSYIVVWGRSNEKGQGSFLFEYNPKTNTTKFVSVLSGLLLDTHIYKINDNYYSIGNNTGEKGIMICKSNKIDGGYSKIKELATAKYYEGAYLMPLDNAKWRILITDDVNMYYCDSVTENIEGDWKEPVQTTKSNYSVFDEEHFTIIDMLNIEWNELK